MIRLIILSFIYALNFWACGQSANVESNNKEVVSTSQNTQFHESGNKQVSKETQTFKGSVKAGEGNEILYIFQAKANKTLAVKIKSEANNAVFSINEQYRVDREAIEVNGNPVNNIRDEWTGKLPETESQGLYSVAVTSTKGVAKFTIEINLEGGGKIDVKNSDETAETNDNSESVETKSAEAEPQNIKDFYLLMPKKYDGKSRSEREQAIETAETNETIDIKNGYFRYSLKGDTVQVCEASVFKKPDGGYVLAYNEDYDDVHDEKPTPTKLFFLEYAGGQWIDVTTQIIPLPINRKYQYNLPQTGTTIEVWDGADKIYTLLWKNGKFVKGDN